MRVAEVVAEPVWVSSVGGCGAFGTDPDALAISAGCTPAAANEPEERATTGPLADTAAATETLGPSIACARTSSAKTEVVSASDPNERYFSISRTSSAPVW